jgi:triphosphoribosyl-dephospho-CoA synthetase
MNIRVSALCLALLLLFSILTAHADEPIVDKAGRGIKKGAEKAAEGLEKGADAVKHGVSRGLEATDRAMRKADGWVKDKTGQSDKGDKGTATK